MERKVLCVLSNMRENNGVANCMMNYFDAMSDQGIAMDFLCLEDVESMFIEHIRTKGGRYLVLPQQNHKPTAENLHFIRRLMQDNTYDIVHVNIVFGLAYHILKLAKQQHIAVRILHAHNPRESNGWKNTIRFYRYNFRCNSCATHYIACTAHAGKSVFGRRRYTVIPNAVDVSRFTFDPDARKHLRKRFGIEEKWVVGVSARFADQKNPFFTIDIFDEIHRRDQNTVLLWAGWGPLQAEIAEYIRQKGLESDVMLLGNRNDMNKLYSAMDVFLLPSKFEGLGMVFVEAQCSGLYCFASDRVPMDTNVASRIEYLPLKQSPAFWAERMLTVREKQILRTVDRKEIREKGYDLETARGSLAAFYQLALRSEHKKGT